MSTNRSAPNSTATSAIDTRREHVVPHRLDRVRLHQRHVLVRGGVEDDLGPVALEDLPQLRAVAAVGEHRDARGEARARSTSSRSISNSAVSAWSTRTSRAGRTRAIWRQSSEPIEPPAPVTSTVLSARYDATCVEVDLDLLAAEDVLDLHRPDLAARSTSPVISSCSAGQRLDRDALARATSTTRRRTSPDADGDRDQHLVRPVVAQHVGEVGRRAEHAHAVERASRASAGRRRSRPIGV